MADPVSAIAIGSTIMGGVTTAFGKAQEGESKAKMYNYQAGVAEMNKTIAKQNAEYATWIGELGAQKKGLEWRANLAALKAGQGARGLKLDTGSNRRVIESAEKIGAYDQAIIRSDAAKKAYGYEVEAANLTSQGEIYKMSAESAREAGQIGALGSILGTAGSVSSKWMTMSTVFPSSGSPGGSPGTWGYLGNPSMASGYY